MKMLVGIAIATIALAQNHIEPVASNPLSALSDSEKTEAPAFTAIHVGQSEREVLHIMGGPHGYTNNSPRHGQLTEDWKLPGESTFLVIFKHNRVVGVRYYPGPGVVRTPVQNETEAGPEQTVANSPSTPPPAPGKAERVVRTVANSALALYLTQACPSLYRKPMLFLTGNDVQVIQQCNANGFMLFGLYIYTGPR